jgi:hypothetical protein
MRRPTSGDRVAVMLPRHVDTDPNVNSGPGRFCQVLVFQRSTLYDTTAMATNSTQAVSAFQQFVSGLEEQIRTLRNDKLAIQASLQTSKTECSDLRRQNNILLKRNDALEKREFDAMNIGTMLAERLGYGSLGEALEGIPTSVDLSEQQRRVRIKSSPI